MMIRSGREEGLPYSLSRWTDVPAAKWGWFLDRLHAGHMEGFDPRTAVPAIWSLKPEDTLGLIFWTKNPTPLLSVPQLFNDYPGIIRAHVTLTGWEEEEPGVPTLDQTLPATRALADIIGGERVTWRFSPVPLGLSSRTQLQRGLYDRFERIAEGLNHFGWGRIETVFLSFLQTNDRISEIRSPEHRIQIMCDLAEIAQKYDMRVRLCNEDRTLLGVNGLPSNLSPGVCAPPEDFWGISRKKSPSEGCGCVLAVEPFGINESCTYGCRYCLDPSTPVLFSDLVWRPIGEVKVGDQLIGFDELPLGYGRGGRKMRETIVEAVAHSKRPTTRIITQQSDIVTTDNHGWINDRGRWLSTAKLWSHGPLHTKLRQIGQTQDLPFTDLYKLGYLAAMSLGDGTMRYHPEWRDMLTRSHPQAYWRIALKEGDEAPLGRLVSYLASFGVEASIRPFNGRSASDPYMMPKVEIRAKDKLHRIHGLLQMSPESPDYWRGFLAGFYDTEGGMSKNNLRIHQKDRSVLLRVGDYARKFGFDLYVEPHSGNSLVGTSRLRGTLRERMRFISTIRPALARKSPDWLGSSFETDDDPVMYKEKGPVRDVVDIQTSTHTFFAAGIATHNCYAADETLAGKKRNTTRHLTTVR